MVASVVDRMRVQGTHLNLQELWGGDGGSGRWLCAVPRETGLGLAQPGVPGPLPSVHVFLVGVDRAGCGNSTTA